MYDYRDHKWDINDFINEIFLETKCWKKLYWRYCTSTIELRKINLCFNNIFIIFALNYRFWSHINYLHCLKCNELFPCSEMPLCNAKSMDIASEEAFCHNKTDVFDPCHITKVNIIKIINKL